jgi:hypothetical protein
VRIRCATNTVGTSLTAASPKLQAIQVGAIHDQST